MNGPWATGLWLVITFIVAFSACILGRKFLRGRQSHPESWAATLSYVATAYGVVVGFSILFLFGQFADARQAVGDEATSIGTAFEQASLFPEGQMSIQRALICYGRAVPADDWPALAEHQGGSAKVDVAYHNLVVSVGVGDQPAVGALHAATATNLASQIGSISTARETRIVAAESRLPGMLWALLIGGGTFVVISIFVVTLPATRITQAFLVSMAAEFTLVLLLIVVALSNPFAAGGGRVTPQLIEQTVAAMTSAAPPAITGPCNS